MSNHTKNILIYGDSNAWGADPINDRYSADQQWPNILANLLSTSQSYSIRTEGLCGRTAGGFPNSRRPWVEGQHSFEAIARTALPLDYIILALGTNDLSSEYGRTAEQIANDILWYESYLKNALAKKATISEQISKQPQFIYLLPPNFADEIDEDYTYSDAMRCEVNDLVKATINNSSDTQLNIKPLIIEIHDVDLSADGIHFSAKGHQQIAQAVYSQLL
jgi:lysophospholipase L1-like esterase